MRLYFKFFVLHLKSQMQYKISFLLTFVGNFFVAFTVLLGIYFMFLRFNEIEGFSFEEVLLCFGVIIMAHAIAETFGRGFDTFPQMLGNGQFDRALVRPQPIIFMVLTMRMEFSRLSRAAQAVLVFAYAIPNSGVIWTWDKILTLAFMVICGALVFFCFFLIYAGATFFTLEGLEFMNIFIHGGREFGRYPFSIYGQGVLRFLTFAIPLALIQYYPLLYLLGRENNPLFMFTPVISLLFFIPSYGFFRFGLSRYKSTGS